MIKKLFVIVILVGLGFIFYTLFQNFDGSPRLNKTAAYYAKNGPSEVGAANLVTAVVVTYRGLDTLGEVTILFLTAAIIGFFLKVNINDEKKKREIRKTSEILETASKVLLPVIFLFGIYIFINGHLTPGGGFQGGAVIASAFVLMLLVNPIRKFNHSLISAIESVSGIGFVFVGVLGILLAGGFLDNRIIALGTFGELLSAGAIPLIYIFVGLKVGTELSNILISLNQVQEEPESISE